MTLFVLRRIGLMALTLLIASLLVFLLLELSPGNVAGKVLGPYATEEQRAIWMEAHGYTRPVFVRYGEWLTRFVSGDFGESLRYRTPVADVLWPRLWNTGVLGFWTFALMVPLGLGLGVLAGMRVGSALDRLVSFFSILTASIPEFASAVFLSTIFVFALGWLPGTAAMVEGFEPLALILPVSVLLLYGVGYIARITRASMSDVMETEYIRTAVLKGLPRHQVILHHALPNALLTPFTVILLQINWLLSGVIVVEFFFAYKGFGALLLEAALNQDIYLIEACTMVAVSLALVTQSLADVGYAWLNPRIRFGGGEASNQATTS